MFIENLFKSLGALFVFTLVLLGCPGCAETEPEKPNILFIAVDDMNDWIAPLGGLSVTKTPNLDELANQSVLFTNAHCAAPACAPSRLAIMTGTQPSRTDVMQNVWFDGPQWREIPLLVNIETVEQFFKNRGYTTLAGGKIYHTLSPPWQTINQADPAGWDFYFPSVYLPIPYQIRAPEEVIHPDYIRTRRPHEWFTWGPVDVPDEKMADYHVVDWARYELSQKHDKPFYLACGIFRPHMPWEVPQKYFDMYPPDEMPDLVVEDRDLIDAYDHGRRHWHKFVVENNEWKKVVQAYLASISFADAQLGRLLEALRNSAYAENTIVVLWADHGMHIGEKENWEKFTLWEESTRVPLLFRAPGVTTGGQRCNQPVSLLDIYPTLVELAGFEVPEHCDGESLMPQFQDVNAPRERAALTSYRFASGDVGHSLRTDRYRYIYYEGNGLEELYDHNTDPNEFRNIAYKPANRELIEDFRLRLTSRVDRFAAGDMEGIPEGYTITPDGEVTGDDFIPLMDLPAGGQR